MVYQSPEAVVDTFQSTLSMRRATHETVHALALVGISIHALHEESDFAVKSGKQSVFGFQSTLSMRRATGRRLQVLNKMRISIHALHEESD